MNHPMVSDHSLPGRPRNRAPAAPDMEMAHASQGKARAHTHGATPQPGCPAKPEPNLECTDLSLGGMKRSQGVPSKVLPAGDCVERGRPKMERPRGVRSCSVQLSPAVGQPRCVATDHERFRR